VTGLFCCSWKPRNDIIEEDENALVSLLVECRLAGATLDVFKSEPLQQPFVVDAKPDFDLPSLW